VCDTVRPVPVVPSPKFQFQVVTLPVEFNASRRAMAQIRDLRLVSDTEAVGARQTLTAAAMTYVAGALASIAQLLYFLAIFGRD